MGTSEHQLADLGGTDDGAMAGPRRLAARISQADGWKPSAQGE
jgi:hypothetical protein